MPTPGRNVGLEYYIAAVLRGRRASVARASQLLPQHEKLEVLPCPYIIPKVRRSVKLKRVIFSFILQTYL
jgi:hypothetical protein